MRVCLFRVLFICIAFDWLCRTIVAHHTAASPVATSAYIQINQTFRFKIVRFSGEWWGGLGLSENGTLVAGPVM